MKLKTEDMFTISIFSEGIFQLIHVAEKTAMFLLVFLNELLKLDFWYSPIFDTISIAQGFGGYVFYHLVKGGAKAIMESPFELLKGINAAISRLLVQGLVWLGKILIHLISKGMKWFILKLIDIELELIVERIYNGFLKLLEKLKNRLK